MRAFSGALFSEAPSLKRPAAGAAATAHSNNRQMHGASGEETQQEERRKHVTATEKESGPGPAAELWAPRPEEPAGVHTLACFVSLFYF